MAQVTQNPNVCPQCKKPVVPGSKACPACGLSFVVTPVVPPPYVPPAKMDRNHVALWVLGVTVFIAALLFIWGQLSAQMDRARIQQATERMTAPARTSNTTPSWWGPDNRVRYDP